MMTTNIFSAQKEDFVINCPYLLTIFLHGEMITIGTSRKFKGGGNKISLSKPESSSIAFMYLVMKMY